MIPNVSCERCHGPGRAHVEAARRGAPDAELELPFGPDRFTAESLLMSCGTCHRHPSRSHPGQIRPDDPHLARFQPVGILQSRCFRESGGAFSCVTCHDPHARASSDRLRIWRSACRATPRSGPGPSPHAGRPARTAPRQADRHRHSLPRRAPRRLRQLPYAARRCGPAHPLRRSLDPRPTSWRTGAAPRGPAPESPAPRHPRSLRVDRRNRPPTAAVSTRCDPGSSNRMGARFIPEAAVPR